MAKLASELDGRAFPCSLRFLSLLLSLISTKSVEFRFEKRVLFLGTAAVFSLEEAGACAKSWDQESRSWVEERAAMVVGREEEGCTEVGLGWVDGRRESPSMYHVSTAQIRESDFPVPVGDEKSPNFLDSVVRKA